MKRKEKVVYLNHFNVELLRPHREKAKRKKKIQNRKEDVKGRKGREEKGREEALSLHSVGATQSFRSSC